jgi:hypothetical protein
MLTADDINDTGVQVTLFTDASLAAMFADAIEDRYLFINGLGWHYWTGKRWEPCHDKDVREVARQWTIRLHLNSIEAYKDVVADGRSKAEQQAARQETVQWERYQVKAKLDAITALASGIVTAEAGDCDAHPDLLNCDNGVISLKTGRLRRHDPDLLMTKLAPVNYIPNARHPDWDAALEALPADVRAWYQLRLGQAATGHMTPDDIMLVQHGAGENGKGTVMAGVRKGAGRLLPRCTAPGAAGRLARAPDRADRVPGRAAGAARRITRRPGAERRPAQAAGRHRCDDRPEDLAGLDALAVNAHTGGQHQLVPADYRHRPWHLEAAGAGPVPLHLAQAAR